MLLVSGCVRNRNKLSSFCVWKGIPSIASFPAGSTLMSAVQWTGEPALLILCATEITVHWVGPVLFLNQTLNRIEINISHLIFWQFCCNVLNLITCSAIKWIYCWTTMIDHTPAAGGGGALNLRTLVGQAGRSFIALKCRGQSSLDPGWWHLFASVVREY